ncbi:F-box/LRR-repeat protein At4g29420 isoform X2 [Silene latifolia]|uniref:F-box/LRR-repeat protein At4g29420 isoform X2 n=1 Tax=Silene latifolia TaxID=37657 RepID=UPI003D783360
MENLPPPLILDILSRLSDSSDLTRCRLTCKTLNSLSYEVTSLRIFFSYNRYIKSRAQSSPIPFKSFVTRFITRMSQLDSVSLGVDNSLTGLSFDDLEDEQDDLHLTDHGFVSDWLLFVNHRLKTLSFVDFWVQACWRRSHLLSLISRHCDKLIELEVKNAWLSMEGVTQMFSLTSLTLEYVRLDDENLSKVNEFFPCLQTLNLIGVGGLLDPRICLKHLKRCHWTISNAPLSLTIIAPKMIGLNLKCGRPRSLVLETPLLSNFHLTLETFGVFAIREQLLHLQNLSLESHSLCNLISSFSGSMAIKELSLESMSRVKLVQLEKPNLELVFDVFPNIKFLSLGPGAYTDMEASFRAGKSSTGKGLRWLKEFTAYLIIDDIEMSGLLLSSSMEMGFLERRE